MATNFARGALSFHEDDRRYLPADLQGKAVVVVAPTADAFPWTFDAL